MSNVIAKGISSTLKTAEKEAVRANIDAPSNTEMTAVEGRATVLESNVSELSTANNARTKAALNATGNAPIYACRAWVNFNGTDTIAIRASGNISSVTDNGTGDYTINFITAMPDVNYSTTVTACNRIGEGSIGIGSLYGQEAGTVSSQRIKTSNTGATEDFVSVNVSIFR